MPKLSTNQFRDFFDALTNVSPSDDYLKVMRDYDFGYNGIYCFSFNQTKFYFLNNAIFWDVKFQIKDNG